MRGLLLQHEAGLSLVSTAATVDLRALEGFDKLLFVGLIHVHGVPACQAFEHGRIETRAHTGDFGGHGVDGDHAANVVRSELRHRSHLVAGEMNDAHERHQVALACVKQKLSEGLVGGAKMVVGVA